MALAAALGPMLFSPTSTPNATAGPGVACKDVYILGANGSGQPTERVDQSPQVNSIVNAISKELLRSKIRPDQIEVRSIRYPAVGVENLTSGFRWYDPQQSYNNFTQSNLPFFASSINDGVTATYRALTEIRNGCRAVNKKPIIALAGYSQGAMAIHEGLNAFAGTPQDIELVRAAVLLADPGRMPNSAVVNIGNASRGPVGYGLCPLGDRLKHQCADVLTREVDARFLPVTTQACWRGDLVCDSATYLGNLNVFNPGSVQAGKVIHTNSALYAGTLTKALGTRIGQRLAKELGTRSPAGAVAPAPALNPTAGPVGTIATLNPNRSCPAGAAEMQAELNDASGKPVSFSVYGLDAAGKINSTLTPFYTAQSDQIGGAFNAPLGRYDVTTSCRDSDDRELDKSAPGTFTFNAPARSLTPTPGTIAAGGKLRLTAQPCLLNRNGTGENQQVTGHLNGPINSNGNGPFVGYSFYEVNTDSNGNWEATIPIPADAPPGSYALSAQCEGSKPWDSFIPGLQYRPETVTVTVTRPGDPDPTPVG